MDEAEKYQQRLQAIAEKRRLQEEQDKARRQLEDEKLRMQQLKRKSLRDQWLMEGPPLSPDSAGPRSPLWGPQAQQIEENINKLQTELEETNKHTEDGVSAQSHPHKDDGNERPNCDSEVTLPPAGNGDSEDSTHTEDEDRDEETTKPALTLTNGTTGEEKSHDAPVQHTNGVRNKAETLLFLGYMEAKPGQGLCEEDDESGAVIRAERVIINEDGEEVRVETGSEDTPEEEEEGEEEEEELKEAGNDHDEEEAEFEECLENSTDVNSETGETPELNVNTNVAEKANSDTEEDPEAILENLSDSSAETKTDSACSADREEEGASENTPDPEVKINICTETKEDPEANPLLNDDEKLSADPEEIDSGELLEALASQPTLSQTPEGAPPLSSSAPNPNGGQIPQASSSPSTNSQAQFQDIPLDGAMVEEEPLMAPKVEPLTDTTNPKRADAPKTKTCQCCSVM